MRVLLAAAAALLVAVLAAALLLPGWMDPARIRAALEQAADERLGATVTIEGPVRFVLLPRPMLKAGRVSLVHGEPGDPDGLAVTADALSARLDLPSLARLRLAVADLDMDRAEIDAPFPLDIRVLTAGRPAALRGTAITLRDGRIRIGPLRAEHVQGRLDVDPLTADAVLSGTFRLPGGSAWRSSLRLSRPGGDGSATLDAAVEEIYAAEGPSATLTGQLAGDGGFAGRLAVSGPDLARLLPAPKVPFTVSGRASLAGGIAALDDAAVTLDAVPGRLDASLHLPPEARLDLRFNASRLDLDGWRRALAGAATWPLPINLDLSADSATLAGGVLRQVRAAVDANGPQVTVGDLQAALPGGMLLQADGTADLAAATSRLDVRVDGSDVRATASWLAGLAGLRSETLPDEMLRALAGRATIETAGHELEAHDIAATLDGTKLRGDAILSWPDGRPSVAAILSLDRLDVAPLLASVRDGAAPWPWPGLDAAIQLTTPQALVPGMAPATLDADVAWHGGEVDLRHLRTKAPSWSLESHFTRSAEGRWSDAALNVTAGHAADLLPLLPDDWRALLATRPALDAEPLRADLRGSGTQAAASASLTADLGALHLEVEGSGQRSGPARGSLRLSDPNARALAGQFGLDADFLGDGSLSGSAEASYAGGVLSADAVRLHAGQTDLGGAVRLDLSEDVPALSGRIEAAMLTLPALDWQSTKPLPLASLHGWRAALDLAAARVTAPGFALSDLRAHVGLGDAVLGLADLSARLPGGGLVSGSVGLDAAAQPPLATAALSLSGVRLGAQDWHPLGLLATRLSASLDLRGQGFAPAAVLSTLRGQARVTSDSASLVGIDVGGLGGDLSDTSVRAALAGGRTLLDTAEATLAVDQGLATLHATAAASGGASLAASGTIDLPASTIDLGLSVVPGITDPPRIGLRLTGPARGAAAVPDLGELDRWRAAHK